MAESAGSLPRSCAESLRDQLVALASLAPSEVSSQEVGATVVDLMELRSLFESVAAPWPQEWDRQRLWAIDGSRSPRARHPRERPPVLRHPQPPTPRPPQDPSD